MVSFNTAIEFAQEHKYTEAKLALSPLLNDANNPKKSEIAELYGDLIYASSGSLDDAQRMYERAFDASPRSRLTEKIALLRREQEAKTGSGREESSSQEHDTATASGQDSQALKKQELQKISSERSEYL